MRAARSRAASRSSSSPAPCPATRRASTPRTSRRASTCTRCASPRRRRHHQPVQLPGDGAAVVLPARDRDRQHRRAEALARRTRAPRSGSPKLMQEAGLPDGVLNVVHGDKEAVDALLDHPDVALDLVRRLDADRAVHLRRRPPPTASACRRSAARRTTCSCCPTPTSTSPPTPPSTRASARRASAAWRSRSSSRSSRSPTSSIAKITRADVAADDRRRHPRLRHGSAHHARAPRQGRRLPRRRRRPTAPTSSSTAAASRSTASADGFWLGPTLIDKVPTSSAVYRDEIFGPVLSVVRVEAYEDGLELINSSRYGNGTAIFTNDGGAARRFQREVTVGMIGINVPIPVPVGVPLVRRLEGLAVRRHEGVRPATAFDFFTRRRPSRRAGSTRATAASTWASRSTTSGEGDSASAAGRRDRSRRPRRRPELA